MPGRTGAAALCAPVVEDRLIISYGAAAADPAAPVIVIDRAGGRPLRLADGPYPFPEPPDLFRLATTQERLDFLREHLESLCGLWDKRARLFLDAYFDYTGIVLDAAAPVLTARLGGLFAPRDWSFAALRPLPQAHLAGAVRVDFAFWTGAALVAVELLGSATPRRQRQAELTQLRESGVTIITLATSDLQQGGAGLLARTLPAPFHDFWRAVPLPASPFVPPLDDIVTAG